MNITLQSPFHKCTGPRCTATRMLHRGKHIAKYMIPFTKIGTRYIQDTIILRKPKVFAEWLTDYLIELGPIFVKVGQTVSTRKDLVPIDIIESLQRLQDDVTPFSISMRDIGVIIEEELKEQGRAKEHWDQVFDHIHPIPIAAASIAQVHLARLKNGTKVVIKLQRPKLQKEFNEFEETFQFLEDSIRSLPYNTFPQLHDSMTLLRECILYIKTEIDFRNERNNMYLMQKVFQDNDDVIVPRVFSKNIFRELP
jgi:ubiquinone biosynthesis protein